MNNKASPFILRWRERNYFFLFQILLY